MVLDFKAFLDPAKIREAEQERERIQREQSNRDDRTRAALAALGRIEDAGRLNDAEAKFVRQATARWSQTRYLSDRQVQWLMDLAERHSLILREPAGTYIQADTNGFVVQSARGSGSTLVVVPDLDTLVELGIGERWSDRDIVAIRKRWGSLQTQSAVISRFSFGRPATRSTHGTSQSSSAAEQTGTGGQLGAVAYTPFFQGKSPFSNWHKAHFVVEGTTFNCVEQYMMFCKAKLFGDERTAESVLSEQDPGRQKALGRQVAGFVDSVWIENRMSIVRTGILAKFSQNPHLRDALLATAGTELVEASPYDKIWGVGLPATDPRINDRSQWRGENRLGLILTEVREHLISEQGMVRSEHSECDRGRAEARVQGTQAPRFRFGPALGPEQVADPSPQAHRRQRFGG